ncbi:Na(+)/H(+) antiporter subunit E [Nocardioides aquaticus]|jgi:multicomponent Na+:H+ antiporter subunit E|uniref:Na(+)/H(+) antiporter subunit E n=1 Tax=Nocardioides aquaticus TaxID=160826 RepID=A0ABX8ENX4_9ACTN|nr:Na+/H+ antiporter subunit E [Nocardioides aquaticus]QVT81862.1 Na(+)/H(+) antiporter subunit E [Nocardioides aquaticus]
MSRLRLLQWPVVLWLTLVWCALWGSASPKILLSGALVGVAVCVVFPLPRLRADGVVRPWPLLVLLGRFLVDVVVASVRVSVTTLRPGHPRSAIVQVDLATSSDLVLTVVAELVSLVPGAVVIETRRSTHTLFLHVLDAPDPAAVEESRAAALAQEQRVLRAFARKEPAS